MQLLVDGALWNAHRLAWVTSLRLEIDHDLTSVPLLLMVECVAAADNVI